MCLTPRWQITPIKWPLKWSEDMTNEERKEEKSPQSNGVGWFLLPVVIHFLALVWVCPIASLNV